MTSACLVGGTGLVGSHLRTVLSLHTSITSLHLYSRKILAPEPKWKVIPTTEAADWPTEYPSGNDLFFSALGTTARLAGSFQNQRAIDYDLNLALAKASKECGVKVYVLISTSGADPKSMIPYSKMKGQLDEAVKALGFEQTIIVKPGLLVGDRDDSRPGEFAARKVASFLGSISGNRLKDGWANDAKEVARAAVVAAMEALHGVNKEKVRILGIQDIVRLGRTEWKDDVQLAIKS